MEKSKNSYFSKRSNLVPNLTNHKILIGHCERDSKVLPIEL